MNTLLFTYNTLFLLTPVLCIFIVVGGLLRRNKAVLAPSNRLWAYAVHALWYVFMLWVLTYTNITVTSTVGLVACMGVIAYHTIRKLSSNSLYLRIARENIGLCALILALQLTVMLSITVRGSLVFDMSQEVSLAFILYSIAAVGMATVRPRFLYNNAAWKDSFYRGWYYTLCAWILAFYGVEIFLLSSFLLAWGGSLLGHYYTSRRPIGCQLARENLVFITVLWCIRSFFYQPFIVPTSSLEPTIYPGDFVLVNQYAYGLRFPVWGWKLYTVEDPHRGDIVVFRYPPQPQTLYVKRVIGIPGDHVSYTDDTLTINGTRVDKTFITEDVTVESNDAVQRITEHLPGKSHDIFTSTQDQNRHRHWEWAIPEGHYLMLGDNRQASNDSRFWGLVPESHIVGKVEYVILSINKKNLDHIHLRADRWLKNVHSAD